MDNLEIINLWKKYDERLEKTLSLNHKLINEIQQQKAKNALKPARNYKIIAVLVGLVYAALIAYFWYHLHTIASIFLNISVGIHFVVTLIAIAMYIRQLVLISEIDRSENIILMQQKMAKLRSSTIKVIGVCFLQFPVFATWSINFELINDRPWAFWGIQMPFVVLFTYIGIWFYKNLDLKNMDKRWFRMMFWGAEWSAILRSGKLLKEIETFEQD